MSTADCACDRFAHLEGAAVHAYISQFLEKSSGNEDPEQIHYRCRVCGRPWVKTESEDRQKPSLVRQEMEFEV